MTLIVASHGANVILLCVCVIAPLNNPTCLVLCIQVIARANDSNYGLACGIFGRYSTFFCLIAVELLLNSALVVVVNLVVIKLVQSKQTAVQKCWL